MAKQKAAKQKVTFSLAAPAAKSVQLAGDFTNWQENALPMKFTKSSGIWKCTVLLAPGRYQYRLLVDGQWCDDPDCKVHQPNPHGGANCVREV